MSAPLPLHVATGDEPIPAMSGRDLDGPDLRNAMPIDQMIDCLKVLDDDDVDYVALWLRFARSIGDVFVMIERDGEHSLMMGGACDAQIRHRSRWQHFLTEDLDRLEARRELLITTLIDQGRYSDQRPADPRGTTKAVRDFLRTGGRILIDPQGKLTEGGGVPRAYLDGDDAERAEVIRASRAYFGIRRRMRADLQIIRAVRMLGTPTENGWIVLEGGTNGNA